MKAYLTSSLFMLSILCVLTVGCDSGEISNGESAQEEVNDPLPSWNDGDTKQSIMDFVNAVSDDGSADFIPESERIATFDNDGTLWSEQPLYFQLLFAIDRIKAMAPDHPEWKGQEPYRSVIEDDMSSLAKQGTSALLTIIGDTHSGMTTSEFEQIVEEWLTTARHPTKDKLYTELVYQPMLELLDYLRSKGFKTFIVSGGGIEFMRPWTETTYGIPPEQVVGSSIKTEYDYNNGNPVIRRLPEIDFIDDKAGKPVGINRHIGRKPVFVGGNSDGDLQMMQWSDSGERKSFQLYIRHTDSTREWSYDRNSHIGKFDQGLDEAMEKGWTVVDMAQDWKVIYPYELTN